MAVVAMVVAPVERSARAGPASHRRSLVSRRRTSMLAPSCGASWKTMYRFILSRSDSAYGRGELSVWCSADPRRIAEARNRHFGTFGVAVSARPTEGAVTDLAYVPRESPRPGHVHFAGDITARVKR